MDHGRQSIEQQTRAAWIEHHPPADHHKVFTVSDPADLLALTREHLTRLTLSAPRSLAEGI
jgi:hypothetical protein